MTPEERYALREKIAQYHTRTIPIESLRRNYLDYYLHFLLAVSDAELLKLAGEIQ